VTFVPYQAPGKSEFYQLTIRPSKIEAGDWLRDLGRYRQVRSVEPLKGVAMPSTLYSVCFTDDGGGDCPTLSIPEAVPVTVWRELRQSARPPAVRDTSMR